MKRILIAGQDSYIGVRLDAWLDKNRYRCDTLDMRGEGWRSCDFSVYDSVVLVAGIAHCKKIDADPKIYEQVNHLLAAEVGEKAKRESVGQLVFFSSMSVYGVHAGRIHADTPANPNTTYGRSKLNAETVLAALADDTFHVAILRPPMIYGPGCKGNYPRFSRLVQTLHVLPAVKNERSMLYINTLCAFMDSLLQSGGGGLYFPQNRAYVSTDDLAFAIAKAYHFHLFRPRGFAWLLRLIGKRDGTIAKMFGTLTYDLSMSETFMPRDQAQLLQSIRETEVVE